MPPSPHFSDPWIKFIFNFFIWNWMCRFTKYCISFDTLQDLLKNPNKYLQHSYNTKIGNFIFSLTIKTRSTPSASYVARYLHPLEKTHFLTGAGCLNAATLVFWALSFVKSCQRAIFLPRKQLIRTNYVPLIMVNQK